MKRIFVALAALSFAAAAVAGKPSKKAAEPPKSPFENVYRDATAEEIEAIREAMQDRLKDADSAKFRNVRIIGPAQTICGQYNAKNGMGAYAGYSTFLGYLMTNKTDHVVNGTPPGQSSALIFMTDEDLPGIATKSCKAKGM